MCSVGVRWAKTIIAFPPANIHDISLISSATSASYIAWHMSSSHFTFWFSTNNTSARHSLIVLLFCQFGQVFWHIKRLDKSKNYKKKKIVCNFFSFNHNKIKYWQILKIGIQMRLNLNRVPIVFIKINFHFKMYKTSYVKLKLELILFLSKIWVIFHRKK